MIIIGKYEAAKAEIEASIAPDLQKEMEEIKCKYSKLKVHFVAARLEI